MAENVTEANVRALFPEQEGYRFFPTRYAAGVKFAGSLSQAGRVYVFEGCCAYHTSAGSVCLKAGESADLQPGQYEFEAAELPVRLMKVYKL